MQKKLRGRGEGVVRRVIITEEHIFSTEKEITAWVDGGNTSKKRGRTYIAIQAKGKTLPLNREKKQRSEKEEINVDFHGEGEESILSAGETRQSDIVRSNNVRSNFPLGRGTNIKKWSQGCSCIRGKEGRGKGHLGA